MKRLFLLAILMGSVLVHGAGFQLALESAADVLGAGGAVTARKGHASVAWYNPAASTTIDRMTISAGGTLIDLAGKYTGPKGVDHLDDEPRWTGFFYGIVPLTEEARFSLSVNAPYGMITSWSAHSQLRDLATFTSIRACYISPGFSYKLADNFSVAAGFNVVVAVARLAKYISALNNKMYMRADDQSVGGFVSLFWDITDDWSFGAHYQSKVKLDLEGDASYRRYSKGPYVFQKGDVSATMEMPAFLALGIENHSLEKWRFMFDAVWTQWSSYKNMNVNFERYPAYGTKRTAVNNRDWHDTWSYRFGVEYDLTEKWTLRGGYMYDCAGTNSRTLTPDLPDGNRSVFALGVGYQGEHWGFDTSYAFVHFAQSHLGKEIAAANKVERGTFDLRCQILSMQVNYKF